MKEIKDIPIIPDRKAESHKGTYGHVNIIGGAVGFTGAPVLASEAALRTGAGLVTCACPAHINTILEIKLTEAMTWPLPVDREGCLEDAAIQFLCSAKDRFDAFVIGPGIGRHKTTQRFVKSFLEKTTAPVVVDADALMVFANNLPDRRDMVLTPHPGEFACMIGKTSKAVQASRLELAFEYSNNHSGTLVLKGHKTIVVGNGCYYVNKTGNPGMATGGSGDVLSGIIGSLLGQGFEPFSAACLGCWLHGRAGDIAAEAIGEESVIAGDLLMFLPRAIKERKENKQGRSH